MTNVITFNKKGYDSFIDFIKAYAIICVLIGHTFPYREYLGYGLWAGMQVPLFILIQAFHIFKKDNVSLNYKKVIWRVFIPFVIVQTLLYVCVFAMGDDNPLTLLKGMILSGGYGSGSYFPWVYLQMFILLPLFFKIMNKMSNRTNALIALICCEGCEILLSVFDLPDSVYRLLAIRYLFLIYLGYVWAREGVVINCKNIVLVSLSMVSIIYFEYFMVNDEPIFYNTAWKFHRWPCYFYVAYGLVYILYTLYNSLSKNGFVSQVIKCLAKCSYEIFLIQMAVIVLLPTSYFHSIFGYILRVVLIWIISILFGNLFNKYYNLFVSKYVFKK